MCGRHCRRRCSFVMRYHVLYFFKTLCRRNPDTFIGWELYLIDRYLYRIVPLTYNTQRIGRYQKLLIVIQVALAIHMSFRCYMFHIASLEWVHDAVYTLWEFILWVQFPILLFLHLLSAKYKTYDHSWLHMVRAIIWFLLFLSLVVVVSALTYVPGNPAGLMDEVWSRDLQNLHKRGHRPSWIINMQRPLECCGYREPNDWVQGSPVKQVASGVIPIPYTCCPTTVYERNCTLQISFHTGCLWKVKDLYDTCQPLMVRGAVINLLILVLNYGLFRYLYKRNSQGWQIDITWNEALLPVLRVEYPQLPTGMKKQPIQKVRMTESEAILDMFDQINRYENDRVKEKAMRKATIISRQ